MLNKKDSIIFLVLAFAILASAGFVILKGENIFNFKNQAKIDVPKINKVSILAFGDMMLDRSVYLAANKAGDFNFPFLKIDPLLQTADLRIVNLEGPITNFKSVSNSTSRMRFTISPQFLAILKPRFNILSLANNHMLDFGEDGYNQTKANLASAGIGFFGDYKNRQGNLSTIIEKNNIKIGFIGYHGLISEGLENVLDEIVKLKQEVDFLIVVPHWGAEYKDAPAEETRQKARQFIDAGADLVLGGHPHVVQPSEEYKGKMIFYSLGNFIFDQYFSQETMESIAVEVLLEKGDNGIEVGYKQYKIIINNDSQPEIKI